MPTDRVFQPVEALQRAGHALGLCRRRPAIIKKFLLYRTYCGGAMAPPVQAASIAAWGDETHVKENRAKYREKFNLVTPMLRRSWMWSYPTPAFTSGPTSRRTEPDGYEFARRLYVDYNVTVLPEATLRGKRTAPIRERTVSAWRLWPKSTKGWKRPTDRPVLFKIVKSFRPNIPKP